MSVETPLGHALKCFQDVKTGLEVNKSLQYALAVDTLKASLPVWDDPEVIAFFDDYLYQMIKILTNQSPSKLGTFERTCVEDSLFNALKLLLSLLPAYPRFLCVASRIFDPSIIFYSGSKSGYMYTPGFPLIRLQMAKQFALAKGFEAVAACLKHPTFTWGKTSSNELANVIKTLNTVDVSTVVDIAVQGDIMKVVMSKIYELSEEQMKKENTDHLSDLIGYLSGTASNIDKLGKSASGGPGDFHRFWFENTMKFMSSGSLVLRLYAWEQMAALIDEAQSSRPVAASYIVEGAGTEIANGTYTLLRTGLNANPEVDGIDWPTTSYVKEGTADVPTLLLFRCAMRTSTAKWWFLSNADLEHPGTEKDVDYYLHKSSGAIEDQKEPPARRWTRFTPGINLQGVEPSPTIKRGDIIYPEGRTVESYLDLKLLSWCLDKDVLTRSFSAEHSPHREILARTGKYLSFLACYDSIDEDQLRMIWKSAMTSQSIDITEETFTQLVILSTSLKPSLFNFLIDMATEALHHEEHLTKVAMFAEKYAIDSYKYCDGAFPEAQSARLLAFVWDLYRHPLFDSLKNNGALTELLSTCFKQAGMSKMVLQRLSECQNVLSQPSTDDVVASRIIKIMHFLVTKHASAELVEKLHADNFASGVVAEIKRLATVFTHAKKQKNAERTEKLYKTELASRLSILTAFFGITKKVLLTSEHIQELWDLLSVHPPAMEELFFFLKSCVAECLGTVDNVLSIFTKFICSKSINWSVCGDNAFDCFSTFSQELSKATSFVQEGTVLPPRLGLDTLWDIALCVPTPWAATNSINLLLKSFDTIAIRDAHAYEELLSVVYRHLNEAAASDMVGTTAEDTVAVQRRVDRCVQLLNLAIQKNKGSSAVPAHIVRGNMSRIKITLFHRRVSTYYNHVTRMDVYRNEKGSEGVLKLDVHPYHTFAFLKERLCAIARGVGSLTPNPDSINIDSVHGGTISFASLKGKITDSTRLMELGLVDGCELSLSYQLKPAVNNYNNAVYGGGRGGIGYNDAYETHNASTVVAHGAAVTPPANAPSSAAATGPQLGQLLAADVSLFDCLMKLCQASKSKDVSEKIWQLIMSLPSQAGMLQLVDRTTSASSCDWTAILGEYATSASRTAYLLQIIDSFLQPAPELNSSALDAMDFKASFIAGGGFAATLQVLKKTDTAADDIVHSTTLAVALHIIHFLLFGVVEETTTADGGDAVAATAAPVTRSPSDSTQMAHERQPVLWKQLEEHAGVVAEKLLFVAGSAADKEETGVVHNALMIVTALIRSPDIARELTSNPQSKAVLTTVLRSGSKQVRVLAGEFATQVGLSQPVVFSWLLEELDAMTPSDQSCSEVFAAMSNLLRASSTFAKGQVDSKALAQLLSDKLLVYPREKLPEQSERYVLLGYLEVLEILLQQSPGDVMPTKLGADLVNVFMSEFLFAMPHEDKDCVAICDTPATRQAAFQVLAAYLNMSKEGYEQVLSTLSTLSTMAGRHMHSSWGLQVSSDVKSADIAFSGLKNQGCTCYMNSLLQQLFMNVAFREAVLNTEIPESIRSTVWHKSDEDLVGSSLLFEWANGTWRRAEIIAYDADANVHRIVYRKLAEEPATATAATATGHTDAADEEAMFNIHNGRFQRETGVFKMIPIEGEEPVNEREEAAYRVFEQLQRTFCFMKLSKRRYFDPRPFVDACKTLNLNFNVYHQNDAAEFCDQLLDRLETAMKGKHSKKNAWEDALLKNVFGGKWMYEKIPQDCDEYEKEKAGCGHFQDTRMESYLKVELQIRGKEKTSDSLAELIQGELMDGDNKIQCDVCCQKKATVRRSCFGALPSTLMLHLKRFDLDFTTFETVKLNNRMAFPTRINLLKYTKEGIEIEERKAADAASAAANGGGGNGGGAGGDEDPVTPNKVHLSRNNSDGAPGEDVSATPGTTQQKIQYEKEKDAAGNVIDPEDYEYELQGVLVHAGVAQGGHYYSFAKDPSSGGKWFKFDDEDVTVFDPENIPVQCFGGPMSAHIAEGTAGTAAAYYTNANTMDEDRTSNALMLFYNKVKRTTVATTEDNVEEIAKQLAHAIVTEGDPKPPATPISTLVSGTQAFMREVQESNLQHILSCYLLEPNLHAFVRCLISSVSAKGNALKAGLTNTVGADMLTWSPVAAPGSTNDDVALRSVMFGVTFLLDVVLHCRERAAMRASVNVLREAFEAFPHTAHWFLGRVLQVYGPCTWLVDFLLHCTEATARATFTQLVAQAASVIAPKDVGALSPYLATKSAELQPEILAGKVSPLLALLVRRVCELIRKAAINVRNADEIFVLVRDLSSTPSLCRALHEMDAVSMLCYFAMPEQVPLHIRQMFESKYATNRPSRLDYVPVLNSAFEALAALLGVPQIRQVALLTEGSYWDADLVPEAREAITAIFRESARNNLLDVYDLGLYFEKVSGAKMMPLQIRTQVLDRFATNSEGKLTLEGFLQYITDLASYNPKNVWRDLYVFGFKNDLSRPAAAAAANAAVSSSGGEESKTGSVSATPASGPALSPSHPAVGNASLNSLLTEAGLHCLSSVALYESGLPASDACTRAIVARVCSGNEQISSLLMQQALLKLHTMTADTTWTTAAIGTLADVIKLLIGLQDGRQVDRIHELLLSDHGLATVAYSEKSRITHCRANEFTKSGLLDRYIAYCQDLVATPGFVAALSALASQDPRVKWVKGCLRLRPGSKLTERDDKLVRNATIVLSGAGMPEVNGEYTFVNIKHEGGYYARVGVYQGKPARFTLYKCNLKQGGYQWFLSTTPGDAEPGTAQDTDFYYAHAKLSDRLPPLKWMKYNAHQKDPPPHVEICRARQGDAGSGDEGGESAYSSSDEGVDSEPDNLSSRVNVVDMDGSMDNDIYNDNDNDDMNYYNNHHMH